MSDMATIYVPNARSFGAKQEAAVVAPRAVAESASVDDKDDNVNPLTLKHDTEVRIVRLITGEKWVAKEKVRIEDMESPDSAICRLEELRAVEASKLDVHQLNLLGYSSSQELKSQFGGFGEKLWFIHLHACGDKADAGNGGSDTNGGRFIALLSWFRTLRSLRAASIWSFLEDAVKLCPLTISIQWARPGEHVHEVDAVIRQTGDGFSLVHLVRQRRCSRCSMSKSSRRFKSIEIQQRAKLRVQLAGVQTQWPLIRATQITV